LYNIIETANEALAFCKDKSIAHAVEKQKKVEICEEALECWKEYWGNTYILVVIGSKYIYKL